MAASLTVSNGARQSASAESIMGLLLDELRRDINIADGNSDKVKESTSSKVAPIRTKGNANSHPRRVSTPRSTSRIQDNTTTELATVKDDILGGNQTNMEGTPREDSCPRFLWDGPMPDFSWENIGIESSVDTSDLLSGELSPQTSSDINSTSRYNSSDGQLSPLPDIRTVISSPSYDIPDISPGVEIPDDSQTQSSTKKDMIIYGSPPLGASARNGLVQHNQEPGNGSYEQDRHNSLPMISPFMGFDHESPGDSIPEHGEHSTSGVAARVIPSMDHSPAQPFGQGEDRQLLANTQPISNHTTSKKTWWACPWYKQDPWKYQECAKYRLNRIKDIKQHAQRKHRRPLHCPICFKIFSTESEKDRHITKRTCSSRSEPKFDGMSEQQRKELYQSANRGKSDVEQWYNMWDTIFPREPRPQSPYLGNSREELLSLLRDFWNKRRQEIISSAFHASLPSNKIQTIQYIVDSIFDQFGAESSSWASAQDEYLGDVSWQKSQSSSTMIPNNNGIHSPGHENFLQSNSRHFDLIL